MATAPLRNPQRGDVGALAGADRPDPQVDGVEVRVLNDEPTTTPGPGVLDLEVDQGLLALVHASGHPSRDRHAARRSDRQEPSGRHRAQYQGGQDEQPTRLHVGPDEEQQTCAG